MARPDMTRPDMTRPDMAHPGMTRPGMTRPDMARRIGKTNGARGLSVNAASRRAAEPGDVPLRGFAQGQVAGHGGPEDLPGHGRHQQEWQRVRG